MREGTSKAGQVALTGEQEKPKQVSQYGFMAAVNSFPGVIGLCLWSDLPVVSPPDKNPPSAFLVWQLPWALGPGEQRKLLIPFSSGRIWQMGEVGTDKRQDYSYQLKMAIKGIHGAYSYQ